MRIAIQTIYLVFLAAPVFAQLQLVTSVDIPAAQVAISGQTAYVASGSTLTVFDISDIQELVELGHLEMPDQIYAMSVESDRAYLAVGLEGLHIVHVSNDTSPQSVGMYPTPGQAVDVSTIGTHAIISNLMTGLEIVDISNTREPTLISTVETPGYQRSVSTSGEFAFVVDQPSGVHVFDIRLPSAPTAVATHPAEDEPPRSVTVRDDRAYVVYQQTGIIEIVDTSDPTSLQKLGAYQANGRPQTVSIHDTFLVVPLGPNGVEIVALNNLETPQVTATYNTPGNAVDAATSANHLFIADTDSLLVVELP